MVTLLLLCFLMNSTITWMVPGLVHGSESYKQIRVYCATEKQTLISARPRIFPLRHSGKIISTRCIVCFSKVLNILEAQDAVYQSRELKDKSVWKHGCCIAVFPKGLYDTATNTINKNLRILYIHACFLGLLHCCFPKGPYDAATSTINKNLRILYISETQRLFPCSPGVFG